MKSGPLHPWSSPFRKPWVTYITDHLSDLAFPPVKAEPKSALFLSPRPCRVALGCVLVTLQDLWVMNLVLPKFPDGCWGVFCSHNENHEGWAGHAITRWAAASEVSVGLPQVAQAKVSALGISGPQHRYWWAETRNTPPPNTYSNLRVKIDPCLYWKRHGDKNRGKNGNRNTLITSTCDEANSLFLCLTIVSYTQITRKWNVPLTLTQAAPRFGEKKEGLVQWMLL